MLLALLLTLDEEPLLALDEEVLIEEILDEKVIDEALERDELIFDELILEDCADLLDALDEAGVPKIFHSQIE